MAAADTAASISRSVSLLGAGLLGLLGDAERAERGGADATGTCRTWTS